MSFSITQCAKYKIAFITISKSRKNSFFFVKEDSSTTAVNSPIFITKSIEKLKPMSIIFFHKNSFLFSIFILLYNIIPENNNFFLQKFSFFSENIYFFTNYHFFYKKVMGHISPSL